MDLNLSVIIVPGKIFGESRDRLQRVQNAGSTIITKGRNCGSHFVDHVGKLAVGAKSEVPGTRSGIGLRERRVIRSKQTLGAVESVRERFVQAEVIYDGEAVVL